MSRSDEELTRIAEAAVASIRSVAVFEAYASEVVYALEKAAADLPEEEQQRLYKLSGWQKKIEDPDLEAEAGEALQEAAEALYGSAYDHI